jgi:hypothetical protein
VSGRPSVPSTAPEVFRVDDVVLERGNEDFGLRRHPLVVVALERGSDLDHATLEVRLVSLRDVVAHHDIAVRPVLATAEPQVSPAVVERLRFDRHDRILVAERALVEPGAGRRLATVEHWMPSVSERGRERVARIGWSATRAGRPSAVHQMG